MGTTLLRVNLTTRQIKKEKVDPSWTKDYLGGVGLGLKILWEELPEGIEPLSPQNKLLFMTGPLTGTLFPSTGGYVACTLSPLTHAWADGASLGGFFSAHLKGTGYDGVIIEGASSEPVYLYLRQEEAQLMPASHLWGRDALETQKILREELGEPELRVACIGPAGEKQVLISSIISDQGRGVKRMGMGAVMGSKNLKAIAVKANIKTEVAAAEAFSALAKKFSYALASEPGFELLRSYGTGYLMDIGWAAGEVPVKNWQMGQWREGCISIGGKRLTDEYSILETICYNCPLRCPKAVKIEKEPFAMAGPGPDYEALAALGSLCLNDDLEALCFAHHLCDLFGLDPTSTGAAVAFAMEAFEKGHLQPQDLGGMNLSWGNAEAVIELIQLKGKKKGLGELLGQGVKRASKQLGKSTEAYALEVKGLEPAMHEPRAYHSLAVTYATSPVGPCNFHGPSLLHEQFLVSPEWGVTHRQGRFDKKGKGLLAKAAQDSANVVNSLGLCPLAFSTLQPLHAAAILQAATGLPYTSRDVTTIGERISNLQRLFNLRQGLSRADDRLPQRLLSPLQEGSAAGKVPDLQAHLEEYYALRGWDEKGRPTEEKLTSLGLKE